MGAAGQFGYHAAVLFVDGLPRNDIGTNFVADEDGCGGVVARRLNA
jgi:hypothetical protein